MTDKNKETPGAATPEVTVNLSDEQYYAAELIDDLLRKVADASPVVKVKKAGKASASLEQRVSALELRADSLERSIIGKLTSTDVLNARR